MKSLFRVLAALRTVLISHPLPVLSSLLAFFFIVWESHTPNVPGQVQDYLNVRIFLECLAGMVLFLAIDIMVRWHQFDRYKQFGLYLTAICILGIHFYSIKPFYFNTDGVFFSRYIIFFICYFLILSLSAYLHPNNDGLLWQFNFRLLITLAQSVGYSLVLLIGVLSAVWAVENLFGLTFPAQWYGDIILFVLLVVHTLIFLMLFPSDPNELRQVSPYPQWLRVLAQYILLPVVLIYGSLLYIYVLKILITQKLPNGWVCIPILLYSGAGLLTFSLLYPLRNDTENKTVFTFMRYFFYTLLPLLTLYFIALSLRVSPYGLTENRYMLGILGVWLSALALYWMYKKQAPLMVIPQSLLLVLFFSVVGPWGMYQVCERSQTKRLHHLLQKHHYIQNNQLDFNRIPTNAIPLSDIESMRSGIRFLQERDALMAIHPWLKATEQEWLTTELKNNRSKEAMNRLIMALKINEFDSLTHYLVSFKAQASWSTLQPIPVQGSGRLFHINWYAGNTDSLTIQRQLLQVNQNQLINTSTLRDSLHYNLMPYIQQLNRYQQQQQDSTTMAETRRGIALHANEPLRDVTLTDSLSTVNFPSARLFVNQINVNFNADTIGITLLDAYLWVK